MKKIVVVGLGPVGLTLAVAAGINHPEAQITGLDRDTLLVELINSNQSSLKTNDREFHASLTTAVTKKRLQATSDASCLAQAEVIVVAVGPTIIDGRIDEESFFRLIGEISSQATSQSLVIIASTLPVGMMQKILKTLAPFRVAYAFERITPGGNMLNSVSDRKKIIAAQDNETYEAAQKFFKTSESVLVSFQEAEMTKLLENSYRAANIALIQEWTLLAESMGVNLFSVIDSIRFRIGTHDNIRAPGPGIGGPCLLKDSMIAVLNHHQIDMPFLKLALATSEKMNQHVADFIGPGKTVGVLGLSYRPDVNDIRNSPSLSVISKIDAKKIYAFDSLISSLDEIYKVEMLSSFESLVDQVEVLVVFHSLSDELAAQLLNKRKKMKIVDVANNISDELAEKLIAEGCSLVGVGKGHWKTLGYDQ